MPGIRHAKVLTQAQDSDDSRVRTTPWNATHEATGLVLADLADDAKGFEWLAGQKLASAANSLTVSFAARRVYMALWTVPSFTAADIAALRINGLTTNVYNWIALQSSDPAAITNTVTITEKYAASTNRMLLHYDARTLSIGGILLINNFPGVGQKAVQGLPGLASVGAGSFSNLNFTRGQVSMGADESPTSLTLFTNAGNNMGANTGLSVFGKGTV